MRQLANGGFTLPETAEEWRYVLTHQWEAAAPEAVGVSVEGASWAFTACLDDLAPRVLDRIGLGPLQEEIWNLVRHRLAQTPAQITAWLNVRYSVTQSCVRVTLSGMVAQGVLHRTGRGCYEA